MWQLHRYLFNERINWYVNATCCYSKSTGTILFETKMMALEKHGRERKKLEEKILTESNQIRGENGFRFSLWLFGLNSVAFQSTLLMSLIQIWEMPSLSKTSQNLSKAPIRVWVSWTAVSYSTIFLSLYLYHFWGVFFPFPRVSL